MTQRFSLPIGTLFGVPLKLHVTFVLLAIWIVPWASSREEDVGTWLLILGLVVLCVILHELGHSMAARFYGIEAREIVLYPFGGITRLARAPRGLAELMVALAGPLINLILCVLFSILALLTTGSLAPDPDLGRVGFVLTALANANLLLFLFNLLPALPLDGGRALRGFLALGIAEAQATRLTVALSQAFAFGFGIVAVIGPIADVGWRLILLLLGFVILGAANRELAAQRTRSRVSGHTARDAMMTRIETLQPQDSLEWATRLLLATHQRDFPVVDAWGRVAGLLDRPSLLQGLAEYGRDGAVLDAMNREFATLPPDASLDRVLDLLQTTDSAALLVQEDDKLLGVVTLEKLGQLLEVFERLDTP